MRRCLSLKSSTETILALHWDRERRLLTAGVSVGETRHRLVDQTKLCALQVQYLVSLSERAQVGGLYHKWHTRHQVF